MCKSYSRGQLGLGLQRISQRILPQLYKPGKGSIGTLEYCYEIFQNTLGQVCKNLWCLLKVSVSLVRGYIAVFLRDASSLIFATSLNIVPRKSLFHLVNFSMTTCEKMSETFTPNRILCFALLWIFLLSVLLAMTLKFSFHRFVLVCTGKHMHMPTVRNGK